MFDLRSPWLAPLWRRVAITVVTLAWAAFELWNGAVVWAALFGAAGLWCVYQFFVVWDADTVASRAADRHDDKDEET